MAISPNASPKYSLSWFSRRSVVLMLSAAVTLGLMSSGVAAVVWPQSAVAETPAPKSSDKLIAPDLVAASALARLRDAPVEIEGARTETATSFALPDGSVRVEQHAGVQRFRGAGDKWVDVDLDIKVGNDGVVRPGAHPLGVTLSGGSKGGDLVSVSAGIDESGGARVVGLGWPGVIPEPELSGSTATYRDIAKGVDARIVVTRSGFEQFFVIESPEMVPTGGLSWDVPIRTKGVTARSERDGSVSFVDARGAVVSRFGEASAWDGSIDERGAQTTKVLPVAMRVVQESPERAVVTITPDRTWLLDKAREFPVVIDPSYSDATLAEFDTFVQSGVSSDQSGSSELKVGTFDGGSTKARSFIAFDPADVAGRLVSSAELSLYETWSYSCAASALEAWSVSANASTATRWTAQPSLVSRVGSVTTAKGYSSSCAAGWVSVPLTSLVQQWSGATPVAGAPVGGNLLATGQVLTAPSSVASSNSRYYLMMQSDGNLVVYGPTGARWSSGTDGHPGAYATMQTDGNLVIYQGSTALWSSGTSGHPGAFASMQSDGNLVVYQGSTAWWSSGTATATPPGTVALVAGNESDSYGWKRFSSLETASDPKIVYTYNTPPGLPTGLTVTPGVGSGPVYTPSLTPRLSATVTDGDGGNVTATFQVLSASGSLVWQAPAVVVPNGAVASVNVPSGKLTEGTQYGFRVQTTDGSSTSWWSPTTSFVPDVTGPGVPFVAGSPYTNSGAWAGGTGIAGNFHVIAGGGGRPGLLVSVGCGRCPHDHCGSGRLWERDRVVDTGSGWPAHGSGCCG